MQFKMVVNGKFLLVWSSECDTSFELIFIRAILIVLEKL